MIGDATRTMEEAGAAGPHSAEDHGAEVRPGQSTCAVVAASGIGVENGASRWA